jgi:hypothetical protein
MSRATVFALLFVSLIIGTVAAQERESKAPPQKVAPSAEAEKPRPPMSNIGVKIEVTITDQSGSNAPVTKTLTIIATDRANSSLRSKVRVPVALQLPGGSEKGPTVRYDPVELPLNIDVLPTVLENGRVRMWIVLNYQTATASAGEGKPIAHSEVTVTTTSILESGKPTTISQSADAASDRKVSVELKATILR